MCIMGLIEALRDDLAPRLRPRYRVKVEVRTYLAEPDKLTFIGVPDVGAIRINEPPVTYAVPERPRVVEVPVPDRIEEGYLVVQEVMSGEVITVVELLSPTNKRPGEGRRKYETKRLAVLGSRTHLVEIDLIRAYEPMLVYGNGHHTHYRHPCQPQQPPASGRPLWFQRPGVHPNLLPSTASRRRGTACGCGSVAA